MTLQKREKILLFILILVAVTILPWFFLIRPQMEANLQKQRNLADFSSETTRDISLQGSLPQLEAQLDTLVRQHESNAAIPAPIKAYDIHYFAEEVCDGAGVAIESLTVGDYEATALSPAVNADGGGVAEASSLSIVRKARVTLTLNGTFSQLLSAVEAFAGYEHIRVAQYSADGIDSGLPLHCSLGIDVYAALPPGHPDFAAVQAAIAAQQEAGGQVSAD